MSQLQLGHDYGPSVNGHGRSFRENMRMAKEETFVTRLADAMKKEGIKGPTQLGKRLKVNKQTASKWINGQSPNLSASDLFLIADGLRVAARWLWKGEGSITPRGDLGVNEDKVLNIYKRLPPGWRDDWVRDGQRTIERLDLPPSALDPYPKARVK